MSERAQQERVGDHLIAGERDADRAVDEAPGDDRFAEDRFADDRFADDHPADDGFDEDRLDDELLTEVLAGGDPTPRQTHDGIPITGYCGGEPIPDLDRLPQERWLEVLRPLSQRTRREAKHSVRTVAQAQAAGAVLGELIVEDAEVVAQAQQLPPPRMPAGAPPARGAGRQVNFRLGPNEHARLREAARLFAMRPTTLARLLTVRGVDRALYEERRTSYERRRAPDEDGCDR
jgi:hypothetical protein